MHFDRRRVSTLLLSIGLLCIIGNLYITLNRSTIPRSFDDRVVAKEIGYEKHPGKDDVYWLVLNNGKKIHIDGEVWKKIDEGDYLKKQGWSRTLRINKMEMQLEISHDMKGMIPVMSGAILVLFFLAFILRKERE